MKRFGVCVFTWKRVSVFFESKHPKRVPEYMTFRLMTFLAIYKSYCKQIWNALKNDTKTHQNSSKIHPKSTEMVPRSVPKPSSEISRQNKFALLSFFLHFGATWTILGAILGPSWAPRGSQNRAFWHQDAPKCRKMRSRMRHQKRYEFLIKFRLENVRFWRCWTHPNALYI